MTIENDIDIILLWVNDNDQEWIKEYKKYSNGQQPKKAYFREWENLHFIFRAFEKFTPWVRKIHFVTWGHIPEWLNINHPKLHIVNHKEYLQLENLPVFSSHSIEINIHKIPNLANKFILFNDDTFLVKPIRSERFFEHNLPKDMLASNALSMSKIGHILLNDIQTINKNFSKYTSIKQNFWKWFNPIYGKELFKTLALLPWPNFTGFVDPHMPQPYLKSTFIEVWEKEEQILQETSASRFRAYSDVNQYLFRYWQLAKGEFVPVSMHDTKYVTLNMELLRSGEIKNMITSQQLSMLCLNDADSIQTKAEFEEAKQIIKDAFEKILPDKSSFEL